uniref:Uncharacterized protein n=1 Tax=Lepeophtheirus salmonis TaxID=72036 RepID=A0A0K2VAJ5_LEPSM
MGYNLLVALARDTMRGPGYQSRLQKMAFLIIIHELTKGASLNQALWTCYIYHELSINLCLWRGSGKMMLNL